MSAVAVEADLAMGDLVGGYRIHQAIGGGGMGTVYAAEEPTIRRRVAVKVLRRRFADDAEFVERFQREARLAAEIRHPAIVGPFAFGRLDDGRPYFVMDLLQGESLRDHLGREQRLLPARAWEIAREIASALAVAHEAGLVHRDLKPDNVFLERFANREEIRILDFGIAKSVSGDPSASGPRTQTGVILGTPAYMAPEQWWGAKIDQRTDQYALGIVLFEMLSGSPPFDPNHPSGVMRLHLHEAAPDLGALDPDMPAGLAQLVARLLEKEPEQRFQSMQQVIAAGDTACGFSGAAPAGARGIGQADTVLAMGSGARKHDSDVHADTVAAESGEQGIDARADTAAAPGAGGVASSETDPHADTVALDGGVAGAAATTQPTARRSFRRWLVAHVVVLVGGAAGIYAVGYSGEARHDVHIWILIAGYMAYAVLGLTALGVVGLPLVARRRAYQGGGSVAAWALVVAPGVFGAVGTYMGWEVVKRFLATLPATERYAVFNEGAWEAGASRFLGYAAAGILSMSLVAAVGLHPDGAGAKRRRPYRAATWISLLIAMATTLLAAAIGAPSGALVAGVAAIVLALDLIFPVPRGRELERAAASALCVLLAVALGMERVAGRESIAWIEQPTRSARVLEIIAAASERQATTAITIAAVLMVLVPAALRLGAVFRSGGAKPTLRAWVWLGVLLAAIGLDVTITGGFQAVGDASREALSEQFTLFSQLDPPATVALDPKKFALPPTPALQITRRAVAVNSERLVPLKVTSSPEGRRPVLEKLRKALADFEGPANGPDLSLFVDREVPWGAVRPLLGTAFDAGAVRVELVFTRGQSPKIPATAPPEAAYLLPRDFVAVEAKLVEGAEPLPADARFGQLAPKLIAKARSGAKLRLGVGGG